MDSVLQYLVEAAARCPDKVALADGERAFTYRELLEQSRQVGAFISSRERPGRPIGVLAKHCAATPLLFYGALWAGCFYVPLDPELPSAKLQRLLADCNPSLVLTTDAGDPLPFSGETVCLADALSRGAGRPLPCPEGGPEHPLCLLYTSGSTGTPKGVLKSHGAVKSFVEAFLSTFPLSPDEVLGNQTPFFFDASAKDLYLSMRLGARLEVLDASLFTFPVRLIEHMNRRQVTCISWVPSALALVTQLNTFQEIKPQYLRQVFFVGEVFPMKQLNRWRAALPHVRFTNLYGSTELAGVCCYYEVVGDYSDSDALPIGRALPNCRVFLSDGQEPVRRPGEIGEICVCSPALALGYYGDEEKTAAVFRQEGAQKVLHTGDLAQYREDGLLMFAARRDHQFKHMGRRIEAGEIEAAALALEPILRCCCMYQQERGKIILACQLAPGCQETARDIRAALKQSLADYMVPSKVVLLPEIPLNANGKIDRPALRLSLGI